MRLCTRPSSLFCTACKQRKEGREPGNAATSEVFFHTSSRCMWQSPRRSHHQHHQNRKEVCVLCEVHKFGTLWDIPDRDSWSLSIEKLLSAISAAKFWNIPFLNWPCIQAVCTRNSHFFNGLETRLSPHMSALYIQLYVTRPFYAYCQHSDCLPDTRRS